MALAISYAGSSDVDSPFGGNSFPFTLTTIGDLVTVMLFASTNTVECTGIAITGTGTVKGAALTQNYQAYSTAIGPYDMEIWSGIVTGTGSITCTCSFSASISGQGMCYSPREFTVSGVSNPMWSIVDFTTINQPNGAGGTTIKGPSITPPTTNYAYMGYAFGASTVTTGSTSGYEYDTDFIDGFFMYNPSVAASAQQPTFTQATSNNGYSGMGALILAQPPGGGMLEFF
jgi:hypothetical protein